jgi:glycolate oxidase iron-sulfur subunit
MQTTLADFIRNTPEGDEAAAIIGKCVHCGFCTATCPTYQLLGDELDGPRGRIVLIKQMLEGQPATQSTQLHLDRCLTCRACETTCPSGVQYGRLLEIGRKQLEQRVPRRVSQRLMRHVLARWLPEPHLFGAALAIGRILRPVLPRRLAEKIPRATPAAGPWPRAVRARKVLLLSGCVQPAMAPNINRASARVLDALGIQTIRATDAGCCGAIRLHLGEQEDALDDMRRNIDAWWPYLEQGVEAIVMNASGCGATVKEYGTLLRHDLAYAEKARRIVALTVDLAELIPQYAAELARLIKQRPVAAVAFHSPCSLQHGQRIKGEVESLLSKLGIDTQVPRDAHLCCGSAGTYSIQQPRLSRRLRDDKAAALDALATPLIVSANVGCICHLQSATQTPVKHWIEAIDTMLTE